jgi:hypothetical protein
VKRKASCVILNGDIMDCASLSRHVQYKVAPLYKDEIAITLKFLRELRKALPRAKFVFKTGNHEDRIDAYSVSSAQAFIGCEGVDLPSWLHFKELGIDLVNEKRKIKLGKINVWHGHEFNGGGGVSVARWLKLRCGGGTVDCCGHFHKTDSCGGENSNDFQSAYWGIGCACMKKPYWLAQNDWNHGFATVELSKGGSFDFLNWRVINGRAYH